MPGFFIGRFDLRYQDEASFSQGLGLQVIEAGQRRRRRSRTHIYDPSLQPKGGLSGPL